MSLWSDTDARMRVLAAQHSRVAVAYSGGKDSRAVAELAVRHFSEVRAFHMEAIPGLGIVDDLCAEATGRWGFDVVRFPHWTMRAWLLNGTFCDPWIGYDKLPEWSLKDAYNLARVELGATLILNGGKRADGQWRRTHMGNTKHWSVAYPLEDWKKGDVLAFLKTRDIPIPEDFERGSIANGIGLGPAFILWCHEHAPDDYARIESLFPYVGAVVEREKLYPKETRDGLTWQEKVRREYHERQRAKLAAKETPQP